MQAHVQAVSSQNIAGGWRGAGLYPENRYHVLHQLPDKQLSEPDTTSIIEFDPSIFESSFILQSTPDSKLLRAANAEINAAAMKKEFRTPHQKYVSNLMKAFEHMTIDKGLLKEELEVQGKLITARAERKSGKRLVLEGVTVASDPEVYRKIKALEDAAVEKKKRKVLG